MPAPVFSRRSFTIAAVTFAIGLFPLEIMVDRTNRPQASLFRGCGLIPI
jgi:hypothetical protein